MRALVTGATGFIGGRLVRRLVGAGHEVHVLVRPESSRARLDAAHEAVQVHVDDGDPSALVDRLARVRPEIAYHLAAHYVAEHATTDLPQLIASNVAFGVRVMEAVAKAECRRLVLAGTRWQHFSSRDMAPATLYAATKAAQEVFAEYYAAASGLMAASVLVCDTYGPEDPRQKLFWHLRQAAANRTPLAMSAGEQQLDLVYVDDAVEALLQAGSALQHEPPGRLARWALGSGSLLTLRAVVELWQQVTGRRIDVTWGARPYRAREVMAPYDGRPVPPGWSPRVPLDVGIRRMEGLDA